ncbi:MAG: DUF2849 domain-containing protein [Rhodobacteraceae bacterium]|nr:DUF2849 domain-containing protein [Paracoccaceae bacterium]
MTLKSALQIITANDLLSGEVVYLTADGAWSCHHRNATIFAQGAQPLKHLAEIERGDTSVVGAYLAEAKVGEDQAAMPVHFREAFRATGPSNRFIGKQASAA